MSEQGNLQGWQADPFGLHEKRYFSDGRPTKLVRDGDAESYDEVPGEQSAPPTDGATDGAGGATAGGIDATEAAAAEVTTADAEGTVGAEEPTEDPVAAAATASTAARAPITADAAEKAETEVVGVTAYADAGIAGIPLNLPGLGILRRRPRGQIYAAAGVAAVVVVLAIIAITGGFSPHPKPGTFGALAQSGPSATATLPPLDTAAATVVTASAQKTLAQKTADVALSGTATGPGVPLPLHGDGQVDFSKYAITASLEATTHGGTVAENEIATSKSTYLQLAVGGKDLVVQSTGRHWMSIPLAEGTDLSGNITPYSLAWSLQLLAQQPASVTTIGTKSIGGMKCTGYVVTPSNQGLVTVVQQEWARLGLPARDRGAAMRALQKAIAAPITAWFDPHRQLACEMTVTMQLTNSAAPAWAKQPTAGTAQMTADFTHYGVPVRISLPPRSDSVQF